MEDEKIFKDQPQIYGKKIQVKPRKKPEIGIDTDDSLVHAILYGSDSSQLNISEIEEFTTISNRRDQVYNLIDQMGQDSTISAVLQTYAEDTTEYNDQNKIISVESADADIYKTVQYIVDTLNIDKYIYKWAYCLIKYGDVYVKLFRQSDQKSTKWFLEDKDEEKDRTLNESKLDEKVVINATKKTDHYVHYVQMVPNPAEIFELTQLGKTYCYIKTNINSLSNNNYNLNDTNNQVYAYQFKIKKDTSDVELYEATSFVHGALQTNFDRQTEQVELFLEDPNKQEMQNNQQETNTQSVKYSVKRGQSLLYNVYSTWRALSLLQDSVLLNRLTKSAITRIIQVEIGDMDKNNVGPVLNRIKSLLEQKSAINTGMSLNNYTAPGPVENNVYVPVRNGKGNITANTLGGQVDVKSLIDLDYFLDKMFGALKVPKQFFGKTDDSAGFNGGTSLSIISSRYAKTIKTIQNVLVQMITDIVNLFLLDKGYQKYLNKFTIKMLPPTTQDDITRRESLETRVRIASDIVNLLSDVQDEKAKLQIIKSLVSDIVDQEVIQVLQEQVEKAENATEQGDMMSPDEDNEPLGLGGGFGGGEQGGMQPQFNPEQGGQQTTETPEQNQGQEQEINLPSPSELDLDFSDNNQF